jgi:hypothetical protein
MMIQYGVATARPSFPPLLRGRDSEGSTPRIPKFRIGTGIAVNSGFAASPLPHPPPQGGREQAVLE